MEVYTIGRLLKAVRKEKRISQLDMCRGLCTKAMVSYIENELRVPHRKLIEALFSRLGESVDLTKVPMTKADFRRANLEYLINSKVSMEEFDIKGLLDEYAACKKSMTHLERQFLEFYGTLYENRNFDKYEETLKNLVSVLKITMADYELGELPRQLLTKTEIFILNNIARCKYELGEKDNAIEMLQFLYAHVDSKIFSIEEFSIIAPVILFNLANWFGDFGDDEKALEFSARGLEICIEHGRLNYFAYHLFNKGYAMFLLNNKESGKKMIELSLSVFNKIGQKRNTDYVLPILKEKFGFDFSF